MTTPAGELISKFLRGEFGTVEEVNPQLVSFIYVIDRLDAKNIINTWLEQDNLVIADRYIHSNIAYQCAKLNLETEKEILRKWILKTEYSHYMIPVPDVSLFLHVPIEFVVNNIYSDREGNDRKYLDGNKDIHEVNINLQRAVEIEYINLTETMGVST